MEHWEKLLGDLAVEAARIKAGGLWRTGPRTLMQVLRLDQLELPMIALFGWMLQPEGHHGLGNRAVRGLFEEIGLPFDGDARVYVSREEPRITPSGMVTRADLVVRVGTVCVLVEGKVNAGQHGDQCVRLQQLWGHEASAFVYLTRDKVDSDVPVGWRPLTWRHVADLLTPVPERASAGVREFLETVLLLHTGEGPSMPNEKTQFYLRHWALLSEWAALRADAVGSIESALTATATRLDVGAESEWVFVPPQRFPTFELRRSSWRRGELQAAIALQWDREKLLTGAGPWPYVGVRVTGIPHRARDPFVLAMAKELEQAAKEFGWLEPDLSNGWLWWRYVEPGDVEDVPGSLAAACYDQLERGWPILSARIDQVFAADSPGAFP